MKGSPRSCPSRRTDFQSPTTHLLFCVAIIAPAPSCLILTTVLIISVDADRRLKRSGMTTDETVSLQREWIYGEIRSKLDV
jgi:hypothetical protein